jgi:hypothetical protein
MSFIREKPFEVLLEKSCFDHHLNGNTGTRK